MNTRIITVEDLVHYLFGAKLDPNDLGLLGRLTKRMDRVERLLWTMVITLFTVTLGLVANLIVVLNGGHIP